MKNLYRILVAVILMGVGTVCHAIPDEPQPYRHVNDLTGEVLPSDRADSLENVLMAFEDSTTNQVFVVVTYDLEGLDVDEYATELFNKWGIGTKEKNNGVLILVKAKKDSDDDGAVRIEVGEGLEGILNDSRCGRVIDTFMMKDLVKGNYFDAIQSACSLILPLIAGEYGEDGKKFDKYTDDEGNLLINVVAGIIIAGMIFIFYRLAKKHKNDGDNNGSNSGGGPTWTFGGSNWNGSAGNFTGGSSFGGGMGGHSMGGGASRGF